MKKIFFFIGTCLLISSCEKDISLDLPETESKVVVDGYVEIGLPPYVILSKSEAYFNPIGQNSINNLPIRGAIVTISNGTDTIQLTEIDTSLNGVSVGGFYVALDSLTFLPTMIGIPNTQYTLNIITADGRQVSSSAVLHEPVALDSVWFKVQDNLDSLGFAWAKLSDPDTLGNYYRWFAKRLNKDDLYYTPFGSVFEDKFINGQSFDFAYNRGTVQNSEAEEDENEEAGFYKKGDTIVVKFCSIDRGTYEFWRDAENQLANNGSPFAVPSNVKSNIIGGRGLFATYSVAYDTIIAR
ncbi:MAG: DUF4249 domain-containing protein [Bacteroidetes bacterium]|nr:DUF4249 domain-containing protein [Bacteroidota bacterium]